MATDLFMPREALTAHLEKLVEQRVIRGVDQAESLADVMDGKIPSSHKFAYVIYDRSKNISSQGANSIKSTEVYVVVLAWKNDRPMRSRHGHGMDSSGQTKDLIEWHVNGWKIDGDYRSPTTGKPFVISPNPPEAFYRSGGWAYYPMAFDISLTRVRPKHSNTQGTPL